MNPVMINALGHDLELIDPNVKTYYPFYEGFGDVVKDYSQYGNNGTLKNGAKWTLVSEGGNGIEFDGSDDYIEDAEGRHIIREGTLGIWSKVIIGDKTKIVGTGTKFYFYQDHYDGSWHGKRLTGQFIADFADYCPNLTTFWCYANSFSGALPSFAACPNLVTIYCDYNLFSGSLPSFAACTNLTSFSCSDNSFNGALPSFVACTNLVTVYLGYNSFNGALPSFVACTNLSSFNITENSFSGALPSFAACTNLTSFSCVDNSFSGALPSFAACTNLTSFSCVDNSFSGALPSFAACTDLLMFSASENSFSGYVTGGFASQVNLLALVLSDNAITAAADINAILADLRTSYDLDGRVACTVALQGGTNAAPTGQGITDKTFLNDNGWTVVTN